MSAVTIKELYHQYIEHIPIADQLRLIALMSERLAQDIGTREGTKNRCLFELEGLGAEIWKGIDAQEYVNDLRDEWKEEL
ncbi:hypothetical protein U14_04341 [Candidatus Moduliflexus flocculans]|uniref:Uncharacterized protein n=1 Tax=Candidatus Moduliflexus flocculans TaxID=1499966 RepID=A0A0S6W4E9_9BACT|nr:hypothetical protein U14_04341 [Candidatus Moduliflexus flocculans]